LGARLGTASEPGLGTAIGGITGSVVGGISGYLGAKWASGKVYDTAQQWYWSLHEEKP
jgi:hypothetical protein